MAGQFFTVSVQAIEEIASQTQFVDALLGYLVLKKSSQRGRNICTGGAPSIVRSLGVTRYRADEVLKSLRAVKLGEGSAQCAVVAPEVWNKATGEKVPEAISRYPAKVLPSYGEEQIALPNTFVDGLQDHEDCSPVRQLRAIEPKEDRLDAVRLLLKLYHHQSLVDYGGVDPKAIHRGWHDQGSVLAPFHEYFSHSVKLGYQGAEPESGNRLHYWLVQPREEYILSLSLIQYIGGDKNRCLKILRDLQGLNLFYEVAVVFDADPIHRLSAEPCYPLYIFDRQARDEEFTHGAGRLPLLIQGRADRSGLSKAKGLEGLAEAVLCAEKQRGSGLFLFAATNQTAKLVSVLRLRFRPHTEDIGAGIESEREKVARWKQCFSEPVSTRIPTIKQRTIV